MHQKNPFGSAYMDIALLWTTWTLQSNQLFTKVRNRHNSNFLQVCLCLDEMESNFQISVHLMDVERKSGEMRTPYQKQVAFLFLVYKKSPLSGWQQQQNLFHGPVPWRSCEYQQPHKRAGWGPGRGDFGNKKHHLSVLVECSSYLWIPLPKPHQSKSPALLSVVSLACFLFLKWFQHVGLQFWKSAILWQKALIYFVNQLWIQASIWHKVLVWVAVMKHKRIITNPCHQRNQP